MTLACVAVFNVAVQDSRVYYCGPVAQWTTKRGPAALRPSYLTANTRTSIVAHHHDVLNILSNLSVLLPKLEKRHMVNELISDDSSMRKYAFWFAVAAYLATGILQPTLTDMIRYHGGGGRGMLLPAAPCIALLP